MAETPSPPPGWPFDEGPPQDSKPPDAPPFDQSVPPADATAFEPPAQPAAPIQQPPGNYPPPAAPYQQPPPSPNYPPPGSPYEPPMPRQPPGSRQQPMPPPPPNWGPSYRPPATSNKKAIWITIAVLFTILLLGIGSCTVWFVSTVTAPVDEANRFLAEIDRGDYNAAVERTDPGCNFGLTPTDLNDLFGRQDISYDLNNSSIVNSNATVSGSFSVGATSYNNIEVELRKRDGDWRVCGFRYE